MLLGDTEYSLSREEDLIRAFLHRRPEAIIMTGGAHSEGTRTLLTSADVPIVETWDLPKEPLGDVVGFSNEEAGAAMFGISTNAAVGVSVSLAARRVSMRAGRNDAPGSSWPRERFACRATASSLQAGRRSRWRKAPKRWTRC